MAGPIYYDVAHGKPSTTSFVEYGEEKSVQQGVDLLRRYQFDFLILDRWNEGAPEDGEVSSEFPVPLQLVEFSIDGSHYEPTKTSRAIVCSDRSSPGTHRSLQVFFDTPVHARFFRITYPSGPWVYEMRANLRTYQASAAEKSKIVESFDLPRKGALASSPVRAAIIGASNSVMRMGWTTGAAQAGIRITDNVSLGSSSNSMLATRLPAIKGESPQVLLMDTTVTEYRPMRVRSYDRELSRQMVRHAQAWAAEHGALPVFIIYPHRYYLDDLANGVANFDPAAYFRELCEDLDLPYIDGFEMLQQMADRWGRPVESLYMDEAHLSPGIAQILGVAIGERVWRFVSDETGQATYDVSRQSLAHPFKCVELADMATLAQPDAAEGVTMRNVVTSLLEQPMITVFKNKPVAVPVPDGWEVVALSINARRCNGAVRLTGANAVSRRMDFAKYEGESGYPFVCVRSLVTPVVPKDGYVTVECVDPQDDFEPDEITNAVLPTESPELQEIEIGQLVIRSMDRTDPYVRVRGIGLNLTPGVDLSFAFAL